MHRTQKFCAPTTEAFVIVKSVHTKPGSRSLSAYFPARNAMFAVIIFVAAHLLLLVGVTEPDKFYFDEVHYVPAARQMLAPTTSEPLLNPMHPPLAKQFIALSIASFGDNPIGWRYADTLFGALAIVAVYLCGLVLFEATGPALASALIAVFNQMLFVQSRIAMLDIFSLAFGLFAIAAFMYGFRKDRPQLWFGLTGLACGLSIACKWSGLFVLATCIVIIAAIRLMQGWRTRFDDGNAGDWYRPQSMAGFQILALRRMLRPCSGRGLSFDLHPALWFLRLRSSGSAAPDIRRQHHDRDRRPPLYEFVAVLAVSGAAGLVSLRQDRRKSRRGDRSARQSAGAVAGISRACSMPARRGGDAPVGRISDQRVLFRTLPCVGFAAANARLPLLLSAAGDIRESCAGLSDEAVEAGSCGPSSRFRSPDLPQCYRFRLRSWAHRWKTSTG
jgi:Dolichyl-phosphate-mannose-protein mannosyltransferase